jgi:hypothetical protein
MPLLLGSLDEGAEFILMLSGYVMNDFIVVVLPNINFLHSRLSFCVSECLQDLCCCSRVFNPV